MKIDLEYDIDDWNAQVSSYIDTAIRPAIAEGLTAAANEAARQVAMAIAGLRRLRHVATPPPGGGPAGFMDLSVQQQAQHREGRVRMTGAFASNYADLHAADE